MNSIDEKIQFRLNQSKEKLEIANILLEKGQYNEAIISAYRSIFYAIRVLLIDKEIDSDDPDLIIKIFKKYFVPNVFDNKIYEIILRSRNIKYMTDKKDLDFDHANEMLNIATTILNEIEKHYNLLQ